MTYFHRTGNIFNVHAKAALDVSDSLPVGTYTVRFNEMTGSYYLEQVDGYEVNGKVYGDALQTAERILHTFEDRTGSTGVMLSGEKGSGKTMLAKLLSLEGQKRGWPTIIINNNWSGEKFNGFMQMIEQPTVVIFDEFEKVYDPQDQEKMLTLLDGVYPSQKLYILTCNNRFRIDSHMKNRPGRIFYRIDYAGLDENFIREYLVDNLNDQDQIDGVLRIAKLFSAFNFDILKAMVQEMNRYSESAVEVMKFLNASPEYNDQSKYKVQLKIDGHVVPEGRFYPAQWSGNPLNESININYYGFDDDDDADDVKELDKIARELGLDSGSKRSFKKSRDRVEFNLEHFRGVDENTGEFTFAQDDLEIKLTMKQKPTVSNWDAF